MKTLLIPGCLFTLTLHCAVSVLAQETDLLQGNNLKQQVVAGDWSESPDGLQVQAGKLSRCTLNKTVSGDYRLFVEFTRLSGNDGVVFLIPVGPTDAAIELSGWEGEAHGLVRIDGLPSKSPQNPTSVRPGRLENNKRYRLEIDVKENNSNASIQAKLNDQEIINWTGKTSRLQPHIAFTLRKNGVFGLGAQNSSVIFHSVKLSEGEKSKPTTSKSSSKLKTGVPTPIELTELATSNSVTWNFFNGAQFNVKTVDSTVVASAVTNAGSADRGAILQGINIESGVIEVDIQGANQPQRSFLGIVFHGVDGRTYESVYFRPFNFGSSDPTRRSHAIQYIAHPDWPWDRLREEKPNQYESRVNPEPQPEDWCRLKVQFDENRVRAYVDNSEQPSLDVLRLNETVTGSVGLWFNGIANFRNFVITKTE